jgi:hypothetical protein
MHSSCVCVYLAMHTVPSMVPCGTTVVHVDGNHVSVYILFMPY